MAKQTFFNLFFLLTLAVFSGCMATNRETLDLRDDMSQLQIRINELQQNQADLSSKMDKVLSNIGPLSTELKETQNRMSFLGQRLDDAQAAILTKMDKLSEKISGAPLPSTLVPTEIYNTSYADYERGNFDLAIKGFGSYLEKYPNTDLASSAGYYLGESYLSEKDYENALKSFRSVQTAYPNSEQAAAAMYKEAAVLGLSGKKDESETVYKNLINKYPNATEAIKAKEKLGIQEADAK